MSKLTDYSSDELEIHFNPRAANPDVEQYSLARSGVNRQALAWPGRTSDIAYGPAPLMTLDVYPPLEIQSPQPVQVYLHGGYWRSRDKEEFAFIGAAMAKAGLLAVVMNYPLCPAVTLDAVVDASRTGFEWIYGNIAAYGGSPDRIALSGHSAGAHLAAAIIAHDWTQHGLPANPLRGAVLVSGIYDPAPARYTTVNADLHLTPELAERYNYLHHQPIVECPVHVIVGGGEPAGWIAQSAEYAAHMEAAGLPTQYMQSGSENHFSLLDQYRDPTSDTFSAILEIAGK